MIFVSRLMMISLAGCLIFGGNLLSLTFHSNRRLRRAICAGISCYLFYFALAVASGHAEFNSSIRGVVTNQSAKVIADTSVSLKNVATGVTYSSVTDSTGLYAFPRLSPGNYQLKL